MYCSVNRVDIVVTTAQGRERYIQTDHRDAQEILDELPLSILFCVARILGGKQLAEANNADVDVVVAMLAERPPPALCQAISAAGGLLEVDHTMVELPEPTQGPYELVDQAMRDLAAHVQESLSITLDDRGLDTLQREAWAQGLSQEDDEIGYWTWIFQVAAVAGEVMRRDGAGSWVEDTHDMSPLPFAFDKGGGRMLNIFGRCERLVAEGPNEGPSALLGIIADEGVDEGPLLINLKHPDFSGLAQVACRMLLDTSDPDVVIPVVAYGHDRPNTFAYVPAGDDVVLDLDALHAEATLNLMRVQPTVDHANIEGLELVIVHDDFYAAEKILDAAFMSQLQLGLGAPAVVASVPRKGLLLVANAVSPHIDVFVAITQARHDDPHGAGAPLSATPFMLVDGEIVGMAKVTASQEESEEQEEQEESEESEESEEPPNNPKKRGFLSRLFGSSDA